MKQIIPSIYWQATKFLNKSLSQHYKPVDKNISEDNVQSAGH